MLAYATSKSAIISFTASLALDLSNFNIRVNAVAPGAIDTPMLASFKKDLTKKEFEKGCEKIILLEGLETSRSSKCIYFLASEAQLL